MFTQAEKLQDHRITYSLNSIKGSRKIHGMLKPGKNSPCHQELIDEGLKNVAKLSHEMSSAWFCKIPLSLQDSTFAARFPASHSDPCG